MSSHEGVSCDSCLRFNFRGKRYKCLICLDYDLCSQCHQSGVVSGRHTRDHPMQCILTRTDLDLFFAGENITHLPFSFTCPICGKLGLSDVTLYLHVNRYHQGQIFSVVCPICATLPDREPNQVTDNFHNHLILEHRSRNNSTRETEDNQARIPQRARVSSRGRRSQLNSTSSTTTTTTTTTATTNSRDVIDPISQLLSQLSEAHRVTGSNGTWRLPFERMANTRSLERLMVRHRRGVPSNFSWATFSDEQNSNQSLPYALMDSTSPLLLSSNGNANSSTAQSNQSKNEHNKYLLDKCSLILPENEMKKFDTLKSDRSVFIQELIFACLFNYSINADNMLADDNGTKTKSDNDILNQNDLNDNNENDENNENIKNTSNEANSNQLISDETTESEFLLNLKDEEKGQNVNLNIASETKSLERNVLYSATSEPTFSLSEPENRQLSPIPALVSGSSAFIVPPASLNHRNNKANKVRSTNSMAPPLSIRTTINGTGNTINVVSPSTRRKILKQHTEPHHYN